MNTDTQLAYLAGFFDGEGSVAIVRRPPKPSEGRRLAFHLRASAYNNDRVPLDLFATVFGGLVRPRRPRSTKHALSFVYHANHAQAAVMLKALRPYTTVKAERIDLALRFYALQSGLPKCGRRGLPPEYIAEAEAYHQEMMRMNEKGSA